VCVITDIGLDHTRILGDTIPKITTQKAGIIQPHNDVFMYEQGNEVMEVVRAKCQKQRASLHTTQPTEGLSALGLPLFQQRNLHLAEQAVNFVLQRDSNRALQSSEIQTAAAIIIPGRMETFRIGDKTLIIDGAHNEQKMTALVGSIQAAYPGQGVAALVSAVHGQDERWQHALGVLLPTLQRCIVTSFHQEADDRIKTSVAAQDIGAYLQANHRLPLQVEPDVTKAFAILMTAKEPVLLVTGSLYLLADALRLIAGNKPEVPIRAAHSADGA
jgi:dihydrofolate synthase/folylpolyglutamate synthase